MSGGFAMCLIWYKATTWIRTGIRPKPKRVVAASRRCRGVDPTGGL